MQTNKRIVLFALCSLLAAVRPAFTEQLGQWLSQTVYVPIYSHIYADERYRDKPFLLTATLSIRNTDQERPITLKSVRYFDSEGVLLQQYVEKPLEVKAFSSTRFIVPESESKGGSGAKFLVEWEAAGPVSEPIVESVMIGTKMQQGISFMSPGRVIRGLRADPGRGDGKHGK